MTTFDQIMAVIALVVFVVMLRFGWMKTRQEQKITDDTLSQIEEILTPMTRETFEREMIARNGFVESWMYADAQKKHRLWQRAQIPAIKQELVRIRYHRMYVMRKKQIRRIKEIYKILKSLEEG